MSYNISDGFMRHITKLEAVIDVASLGPLQQKRLYKYANTGVIKGNGIVSQIAKSMRHKAGMQILHMMSSDEIQCHNIFDEDIYTKIAGAITMSRIQGVGENTYIYGGDDDWFVNEHRSSRHVKNVESFLEMKPKYFHVYVSDVSKNLHYKTLEPMEVDLNKPIVINLKQYAIGEKYA